jgi:signal peptidase I
MVIPNDTLEFGMYYEIFLREKKTTNENKKKYRFSNNYYFVLGDNRRNSTDSRFIGFISEEDITGKITHVIFSHGNDKNLFKGYRFNRFFKTLK